MRQTCATRRQKALVEAVLLRTGFTCTTAPDVPKKKPDHRAGPAEDRAAERALAAAHGVGIELAVARDERGAAAAQVDGAAFWYNGIYSSGLCSRALCSHGPIQLWPM